MRSVNSADPACRVIHRFQYFSIVNAITEFYRSACVSEIASVYSCVSCLTPNGIYRRRNDSFATFYEKKRCFYGRKQSIDRAFVSVSRLDCHGLSRRVTFDACSSEYSRPFRFFLFERVLSREWSKSSSVESQRYRCT